MGSTNFLPFNPTQANQLTDSAYLTDATRTGGAGVDAEWPSPSANKTLYQAAGGNYALMQMMANKGFTVLDTNLATLTAVLANILTTADIPGSLQSLPWSASLVLNAAEYSGFQVTLSGATSFTISGQVAGQVIGLLWVQDGTGGRSITFPGNVNGGAQPDQTPGVLSAQLFKVDASLNLNAIGPAVSVNGMTGLAVNAATLTVAGAAPSGQVLTGNGTSYVPTTAPGYTSGSNANGYWQKDPNGKIEQWGIGPSTGPGTRNVLITFPIAFSSAVTIAVTLSAIWLSGQNSSIAQQEQGSVTINGFEFGVSSSGSINGMTTPAWRAVGY
jgi:hypothetical protein